MIGRPLTWSITVSGALYSPQELMPGVPQFTISRRCRPCVQRSQQAPSAGIEAPGKFGRFGVAGMQQAPLSPSGPKHDCAEASRGAAPSIEAVSTGTSRNANSLELDID